MSINFNRHMNADVSDRLRKFIEDGTLPKPTAPDDLRAHFNGRPEEGAKPMTLQELLETTVNCQNVKGGAVVEILPDFRVAVQQARDGGVHFIIHPLGHDGETLDFIVRGNVLEPLT